MRRENDNGSWLSMYVYSWAVYFNFIIIDSQLESYLMCKMKFNLNKSEDRIIDILQMIIELHMMCIDAAKEITFLIHLIFKLV